MKTTLEIPDDLFRRAKAKAALEGRKLKDLVAEGLQMVMTDRSANGAATYVKFPIVKAPEGSEKIRITDQRIKELDLQADQDRHAASL